MHASRYLVYVDSDFQSFSPYILSSTSPGPKSGGLYYGQPMRAACKLIWAATHLLPMSALLGYVVYSRSADRVISMFAPLCYLCTHVHILYLFSITALEIKSAPPTFTEECAKGSQRRNFQAYIH